VTVPTIESQLAILRTSDGLVDLFQLDCTAIGGPIFFFTPNSFEDGTELSWGGQVYTLISMGLDNLEHQASTANLPQPTLSISNVGGPLLSVVQTLGDLVGAKLTHFKTKVSYLDGQANPSTDEFIGPEVWFIYQLAQMTNQVMQFTLACAIDRPGYMFPVRQILVYPNINPPDGIFFPGVSPYRTNQNQSQ
jgi:lambda family phage minor tail protein L